MVSITRKRNKSTIPSALYVGKQYERTLVLYVDLQGNGMTAQTANVTHAERDLYSAGTFLNATLFVEPNIDFLNDLVDVPSYTKAIRLCRLNPLPYVATLGMD